MHKDGISAIYKKEEVAHFLPAAVAAQFNNGKSIDKRASIQVHQHTPAQNDKSKRLSIMELLNDKRKSLTAALSQTFVGIAVQDGAAENNQQPAAAQQKRSSNGKQNPLSIATPRRSSKNIADAEFSQSLLQAVQEKRLSAKLSPRPFLQHDGSNSPKDVPALGLADMKTRPSVTPKESGNVSPKEQQPKEPPLAEKRNSKVQEQHKKHRLSQRFSDLIHLIKGDESQQQHQQQPHEK